MKASLVRLFQGAKFEQDRRRSVELDRRRSYIVIQGAGMHVNKSITMKKDGKGVTLILLLLEMQAHDDAKQADVISVDRFKEIVGEYEVVSDQDVHIVEQIMLKNV
jgi:hypothetical protein